jgi:hypothetical protein
MRERSRMRTSARRSPKTSPKRKGLNTIPREGHTPHDHNKLSLRFCKAAGLSSEEVRSVKMTPVWWGRAL